MKGNELVQLLDIVDPMREAGKVTLITRYGEEQVESMLGPHIEAVRGSGHVVVWQCDPMHGYSLPYSLRKFWPPVVLILNDLEIPV